MPANQPKRDYYETLGVDQSATRDQIKQAYRHLALKYHPDRNHAPEAEEQFKEIAEAYAVLSDDVKRREYDTTGHIGVSERWSTEDLMRDFQFGDFFGGRFHDLSNIFGDFFGQRTQTGPHLNRGRDLRYDLALRVSKAFGSTPEHWLKMQMAYDLAQMQKKAASIKVKRFPKVETLPV